jgi:hypothetical protein
MHRLDARLFHRPRFSQSSWRLMDADALSTLFLNLSRIHWYNMALRGAAMPVFFEFE